MNERQRLLALLGIYEEALQGLYLLDGRDHIDLIWRLERRLQAAKKRLDEIDANAGALRIAS